MAAEIQMTFRSAGASPRRRSSRAFAGTASSVTARFWFVVAIVGLFAFTVASFHGRAAARVPSIKAAHDGRKSIAHNVAVTIVSSAVDAVVNEYRNGKK